MSRPEARLGDAIEYEGKPGLVSGESFSTESGVSREITFYRSELERDEAQRRYQERLDGIAAPFAADGDA